MAIKICIIDTGICKSHQALTNLAVNGISINNCEHINDDYNDEIGHGTAVCNILYKHNHDIEVFAIKLFSLDELCVDQNKIMFALNYVYENIECDILNLSLGSCQCQKPLELYRSCCKIREKGTIIVAAFENGGAMSYPAAFDNVIGVTSGETCININDIEYYVDSEINIATKGNRQKVAWIDPPYIISSGNSFACAHASGIISVLLSRGLSKENIMDELRREAKFIYNCNERKNRKHSQLPFVPYKAVVFPFNKEIHSILRYKDMLNFDIVDVYDTKYSSHVGASTNKLQNMKNSKDYIIKNIDNIDINTFDTFILGHVSELKRLMTSKLDIAKLLEFLLGNKKYIFSLDDLTEYKVKYESKIWNNNVYTPNILKNDIGIKPYGKLYRNNTPVLCVCGTSSKQGKFSLQLLLRRCFIKDGYSVGQLGTEPTSLLFGFDDCFHYGFNSNIPFSRHETIAYVNEVMNEISYKDVDIIITGAQSAMITQYEGNLWTYPLGQYEFLLGVQPDIVILCINPYDSIDYIERTIKFIEGSVDCKVLSLVLFPKKSNSNSIALGNSEKILEHSEYTSIAEKLSRYFSLPVFRLDYNDDIILLEKRIIEYLE